MRSRELTIELAAFRRWLRESIGLAPIPGDGAGVYMPTTPLQSVMDPWRGHNPDGGRVVRPDGQGPDE